MDAVGLAESGLFLYKSNNGFVRCVAGANSSVRHSSVRIACDFTGSQSVSVIPECPNVRGRERRKCHSAVELHSPKMSFIAKYVHSSPRKVKPRQSGRGETESVYRLSVVDPRRVAAIQGERE